MWFIHWNNKNESLINNFQWNMDRYKVLGNRVKYEELWIWCEPIARVEWWTHPENILSDAVSFIFTHVRLLKRKICCHQIIMNSGKTLLNIIDKISCDVFFDRREWNERILRLSCLSVCPHDWTESCWTDLDKKFLMDVMPLISTLNS